MKKLVRIAANIYYTRLPKAKKKDPERFAKQYNFVLTVEGTQSVFDPELGYVQTPKLEEIEFAIGDNAFDEMINHFQTIRKLDETDIKNKALKPTQSK